MFEACVIRHSQKQSIKGGEVDSSTRVLNARACYAIALVKAARGGALHFDQASACALSRICGMQP
eukprot:6196954-Pleurochrysis_carterae.AAC.2